MDRYTFRGKRLDNCEWVYGSLLIDERKNSYSPQMMGYSENDGYWSCDLDPQTIGQCTGIKDKNGNLIYEGDIFHGMVNNFFITYDDNEAKFKYARIEDGEYCGEFLRGSNDYLEIAGNIHDKDK